MLNILYFAKLTEDLDCEQETLDWQPKFTTVADIKKQLSQRSSLWETSLSHCLCAVNHSMAQDHHTIKNGDEIAFFPPVTGG